jgi:cell division protein ZipA
MDKELLRIVIIATGLLIVIGMLTWAYFKNQKLQAQWDAEDELVFNDDYESSEENVILYDEIENEDTEIHDPHYFDKDDEIFELEEHDIEPAPRFSVPAVIQFSLIANAKEGFNGRDLDNAFAIVGLEYGNLNIYERLDPMRQVDFGVACIQEPGTFPSENLDDFYCRGIVFFMQPGVLDEAQLVFDDFIETLQILAVELDGTILDNHREPLTDETIFKFRQSL